MELVDHNSLDQNYDQVHLQRLLQQNVSCSRSRNHQADKHGFPWRNNDSEALKYFIKKSPEYVCLDTFLLLLVEFCYFFLSYFLIGTFVANTFRCS